MVQTYDEYNLIDLTDFLVLNMDDFITILNRFRFSKAENRMDLAMNAGLEKRIVVERNEENPGKPYMLPLAGSNLFAILYSTDESRVALSTGRVELTMEAKTLPIPIDSISLLESWKNHILGNGFNQSEVFYLCKPQLTQIVQRLEWTMSKKGPDLSAWKYICLFQQYSNGEVWISDLLLKSCDGSQGSQPELQDRSPES